MGRSLHVLENAALLGGLFSLFRRRLQTPVFPVGAVRARHPDDLNLGIPASVDGAHPSDSRFYFEWWYFEAELDDGHKVICVFQTPDLRTPMKRENCVIMIYLRKPSGEERRHYVTFPLGDMRASTSTCDVEVGGNYARGEYPRWELRVAFEDMVYDLEFCNLVPGWSRGTGEVLFGPRSLGHVLAWAVPQPRAAVTGTIAYEGQRHQVSGSGYHDHNWGSCPLFLYVTCWHWGRIVAGDITLIYADVMTNRMLENLTVPCLLVAKGDRLLAEMSEETKWEFNADDYVYDEQGLQVFPRHVRFSFEERGAKGTVNLNVRKTWEINETLQVVGVPPALRPAFRKVAPSPIYYRFITDYELELEHPGGSDARSGETVTEYMIVTLKRGQKPPRGRHLYNPVNRALCDSEWVG